MARLYIDTNIFIGFYESPEDSLEIVDEVSAFAKHLVIPEQANLEFNRNRLAVLNRSVNQFRDSMKFKPFCTALIKHQPDFTKLTAEIDAATRTAKQLILRLESARDVAADPVALKISGLFTANNVLSIQTTDAIFNSAQKRKLLGQPPFSKDKATIGDEIIWESLVTGVNDDLIIVSRDRGFLDYEQVLRDEFGKRTGRKLLAISQRVSDGLKIIGEAPPPQLVELEERVPKDEQCPKCGKRADFGGYEGPDGDEAWWLWCHHCGHQEFH